jgi:septum formation protein
MSLNKQIILASSSERRIFLLKQWGLFFKIIPSGADEKTNLIKPSYIVKELAYRKGLHAAQRYPDALILSADTVVVLNGKVIGKPKSKKESEKMIRELNGNKYKVYTGVAVIQKNKRSVFYDIVCIKMRKLPEHTFKQFFGKHMDKAGAHAIQDTSNNFVEKIYGDYYTAVGLPYKKLAAELKKFKIRLKPPEYPHKYDLSKIKSAGKLFRNHYF